MENLSFEDRKSWGTMEITKDLDVFVDDSGRFLAFAESDTTTGAFSMPPRVALGFVVKGQWALLKARIIPGLETIKETAFPFLCVRVKPPVDAKT